MTCERALFNFFSFSSCVSLLTAAVGLCCVAAQGCGVCDAVIRPWWLWWSAVNKYTEFTTAVLGKSHVPRVRTSIYNKQYSVIEPCLSGQ